MIFGNCKAEIKIRKVDNGFILEWEVEKPEKGYRKAWSSFDEKDDWKNPSGVEILRDYKSLQERLKAIL